MKNNKDNEALEVFPRKRLMGSFLAVTMMLIFGIALSVIVCQIYFNPGPEAVFGFIVVATIVFSIVNFKVTRGSFLCAKILRYCALFMALICIPGLFLAETIGVRMLCYSNVVMLFGVFYLIGGKTYQEMVQNRHDFCEEMIEFREAIEKEMKRSSRQGKMSKKR